MGGSLYFYTFTTYMQKYLVNTAHMDAKTVSFVMTVVLIVYMLLQPVFGALSDRIGRRNNMMLFSGLGHARLVPLLFALGASRAPIVAFILVTARARHRKLLHLDQRHGESGAVPDRSARARGGPLLCGGQCIVRRHGGICGAVAQVGGS